MNLLADIAPNTLPPDHDWLNEPESWSSEPGRLIVSPDPNTDLFCAPDGRVERDTACLVKTSVSGDFTAKAHLRAQLVGFGDAGVLTVRTSPTTWAKLCLERSPIGDVSVVSVVNRGVSDDANSELLDTPECWLRVTRKGHVFGMHYSLDGETWRFVRTFFLEMPETVSVGMQAQSPYSSGCRIEFDYWSIEPRAVADFRSGE
jgi:hypothetical protein